MDVMTLLDGDAFTHVYAEFKRVHDERGAGLSLQEFVSTFIKHVAPDSVSKISPAQLVKTLVDLYRQIDVNGDKQLEWSELTSYCIEAAMMAVTNRLPRPAFTFTHDQAFSNPSGARTLPVRQLTYHELIDAVVLVEEGNKNIAFYTSGMRPLRVLDTATAIRKELRDIDASVPLQHAIVTKHRFVAVLMNTLCVAIWQATLRAFQFSGSIPRPDGETPCQLHYDEFSDVLLLGCSSGNILVFSPRTRRQLARMTFHTDIVLSMVSIQRRGALITTSLDRQVAMWDMNRFKVSRLLHGHEGVIQKLVAFESLDMVAGLSSKNQVLGFDLGVAEVVFKLPPTGHTFVDLAVLPTEPPRLVTVDATCACKIWEVAAQAFGTVPCVSGIQTESLAGFRPSHAMTTTPARLRKHPAELWFVEQQQALHLHNATPGSDVGVAGDIYLTTPFMFRFTSEPLDVQDAPVAALYSQASLHFITLSVRDLLLWDGDTGLKTEHYHDCFPADVRCACLDDRHRKLIAGCINGGVYVVNLMNGAIMKSAHLHTLSVTAVIYCEADRCILAVGADGAVAVFDDEPQTVLEDLRVVRNAHETEISALAYSYETAIVATGDRHGTIKLWDFQDLKLMMEASHGDAAITSLACARDIPAVLAACSDGWVYFYTSRGHSSPFQRVYQWRSTYDTLQLFVSRASYLPKGNPEVRRRWQMIRNHVLRGKIKDSVLPTQRPQLAALVDKIIAGKASGPVGADWKRFRFAVSEGVASAADAAARMAYSPRTQVMGAPVNCMSFEFGFGTDDRGLHHCRFLFGDERGRVRVLNVDRLFQRGKLEPVPQKRQVVFQGSYTARRRCKRLDPGPIIRDERFFYNEDDPRYEAQALPSDTDFADAVDATTNDARPVSPRRTATAGAARNSESMSLQISGSFGVGIAEAMQHRSSVSASIMKRNMIASRASNERGDGAPSSEGQRSMLRAIAASKGGQHGHVEACTIRLLEPESSDIVIEREFSGHNTGIAHMHAFIPGDPAWAARMYAEDIGGDAGEVTPAVVPPPAANGSPNPADAQALVSTCGTDGRVYIWDPRRRRLLGEVGLTAQDAELIASKLLMPIPWNVLPKREEHEHRQLEEAAHILRHTRTESSPARGRSVAGPPSPSALADAQDGSTFLTAVPDESGVPPAMPSAHGRGTLQTSRSVAPTFDPVTSRILESIPSVRDRRRAAKVVSGDAIDDDDDDGGMVPTEEVTARSDRQLFAQVAEILHDNAALSYGSKKRAGDSKSSGVSKAAMSALFRQVLTDSAPVVNEDLDNELVKALLAAPDATLAAANQLGPSAVAVLSMSGFGSDTLPAVTALGSVRARIREAAKLPERSSSRGGLFRASHDAEDECAFRIQALTSDKAFLLASTGGLATPRVPDTVHKVRGMYKNLRSARDTPYAKRMTPSAPPSSARPSASSNSPTGSRSFLTLLRAPAAHVARSLISTSARASDADGSPLSSPRGKSPARPPTPRVYTSRPSTRAPTSRAEAIDAILRATHDAQHSEPRPPSRAPVPADAAVDEPANADAVVATAAPDAPQEATATKKSDGSTAPSRKPSIPTLKLPSLPPSRSGPRSRVLAGLVTTSALFRTAADKGPTGPRPKLPARIGDYSMLEIIKVREVFDMCEPDARSEVDVNVINAPGTWIRVFALHKVKDILSGFADVKSSRVGLREVFRAAFRRANPMDVELMMRWTEPSVLRSALADTPSAGTTTWRDTMTTAMQRELKSVFQALDVDGDGVITLADMRHAMEHNRSDGGVGSGWAVEDIVDVMRQYDANENFALELEEFLRMMHDINANIKGRLHSKL